MNFKVDQAIFRPSEKQVISWDSERTACQIQNYMYIVHTRFEWDEAKDRSNRRKHGISFEEAQTVFLDENAIRFFDPDHSQHEDRFIMLGMSFRFRVLVVCHCYRESEGVIRIISARKADRHESADYWR